MYDGCNVERQGFEVAHSCGVGRRSLGDPGMFGQRALGNNERRCLAVRKGIDCMVTRVDEDGFRGDAVRRV